MPSNSTDTTTDNDANSLYSPLSASELRVVLVCDVVESVRWMEQDEDNAIARWQSFANHVREHIAPAQGGTVVKSMGDGLIMEFTNARGAVQAATAMHQYTSAANAGVALDKQMHLRTGIHQASIRRDAHDIYGHGVNLAARITTLAGPGEVIISATVRDHLTDGLDGDIEDMGECYLKHVSEPQRVYRVGVAGEQPVLLPQHDLATQLQSTIAVVPFESRNRAVEHIAIGDLIADGVNAQLGLTKALRVISRMTAKAFQSRVAGHQVFRETLDANYILSGSYLVKSTDSKGCVLLTTELTDCAKGEIVWMDRFEAEISDLLEMQSEAINRISQATHIAILSCEAEKSKRQSPETLAGYSLHISGISLMHRSLVSDFDRGKLALEALAERHRRFSDAHAWLAKWHVLRVIRGISDKPSQDAKLALDACHRALDGAPDNALALAVKGYLFCQLLSDKDEARNCIDKSIAIAPSEVHAWLYRSVWSCHWGNTQEAVAEAVHAIALSPLDPHAYFFNTLLASAYAFNREYALAIETANKALRLDRSHAPTLRVMLLAQVESGQIEAGKETLKKLLIVTPNLTISSYKKMGNQESFARRRVVDALSAVGLDN